MTKPVLNGYEGTKGAQPLTAQLMVLSDATRIRGGRKSRRRVARVWVVA
jgi:hypothetical protein